MADDLKTFSQDLLQNDPNGVGRAALQEELVGMQSSLKRTLDAGVTTDEAAALNSLGDSVQAARAVVDGMWERFNG